MPESAKYHHSAKRYLYGQLCVYQDPYAVIFFLDYELIEEPEIEEEPPAPEDWIGSTPGVKPSPTPPPFAMPTDDDWLTEL